MNIRLLFFTVTFLALTGCGREVRVIDESGKPIPGAVVCVVAPSYNGPYAKASAQGIVEAPSMFNEQWLYVSAKDFEEVSVTLPQKFPITVTLLSKVGTKPWTGTIDSAPATH